MGKYPPPQREKYQPIIRGKNIKRGIKKGENVKKEEWGKKK
jgi:hypothetical protein